MSTSAATENLLVSGDPAPVEWVNRDSAAPVVLLCEHAGREIPQKLGDLGVSEEVQSSHRGWDIGAEAVARQLAGHLQAPLILQRYSRLVIDCNRPLDAPDSIPPHSFGERIPANLNLTAPERVARQNEIVAPLNAAIENMLDRVPRRLAVSIHSFTPNVAGGGRPWHAGFLTRTDQPTGQAIIDHIFDRRPDLQLALNQPYQIDGDSDWFIPHFVEPRGLAHSLVEIRNDLIRDKQGAADWAQLLADAFINVLRTEP
ncbi:N-formylglutamate amidohydrolase [Ruegeria sp. AD91A]|uniref:N-formylglutamate amidohydrolase n=1 Tax=Ruegeria sp. AD91A TaxID=2293862 RepID=UPI000E4AD038|nr:N-formylglutamate amidohydrolase [Ruegeria sp. AD91A]AXT25566.1 N-formylglutamate amidohydrolase [Ruegeria sp. AD91A]